MSLKQRIQEVEKKVNPSNEPPNIVIITCGDLSPYEEEINKYVDEWIKENPGLFGHIFIATLSDDGILLIE